MINIIGAGMAGLLAGNMLRHHKPQLYEAQSSLPNNHEAVLRFRSPIVGDVLSIPFRKVTMMKSHLPWRNPVADALAYSFKNNGIYRSDRSIVQGTTTGDRWIAPKNFIANMAEDLNIYFNRTFDFVGQDSLSLNKPLPCISTIPMPALMKLLMYPVIPSFEWRPGYVVKGKVANCDAFVSLLIPDPDIRFSRVSITGDELIIEFTGEMPADIEDQPKLNGIIASAATILGLRPTTMISNVECHAQRYAKIAPINDDERKAFMHWATDKFNIYSLGRFATWRPNLLLDDLVNDIRLIDRWIKAGRYAVARHR